MPMHSHYALIQIGTYKLINSIKASTSLLQQKIELGDLSNNFVVKHYCLFVCLCGRQGIQIETVFPGRACPVAKSEVLNQEWF